MMRLETENGVHIDVTSEAELRQALSSLNNRNNTFAILASDDERYIQTAIQDGGFIVEQREGSYDRHHKLTSGSRDIFSKEEVADIFVAYLSSQTVPSHVVQQRMDMPEPGSKEAVLQAAKGYLLTALFAGLVIAAVVWKWYSRWGAA